MRASLFGNTATVQLLLGAGADKEAKGGVSVRETESYACTCDKRSKSWGLWWGEDLLGGLSSLALPFYYPYYMCVERVHARTSFFLYESRLLSGLQLGFSFQFEPVNLFPSGRGCKLFTFFCRCRCHMKYSVLRISFLADIFTYFITFHWPCCSSWVRACVCRLLLNTHVEW